MKTPFSKKLLILDYIVAIALILGYFVCVAINGIYENHVLSQMISLGYDISSTTLPQLLNLDGFGTMLGIWIAQLGVSSGAYYIVIRSEHRIELPMRLINELPDNIRESVDMGELITTVLSTSDN